MPEAPLEIPPRVAVCGQTASPILPTPTFREYDEDVNPLVRFKKKQETVFLSKAERMCCIYLYLPTIQSYQTEYRPF